MKRTAAILFILAAIAAQARPVWVYPPTERVRWWSPPDAVVDANGQRWLDPTASKMESCGWIICEIGEAAVDDCAVDFAAVPPVPHIRCMTPAELEAREAARLEAEAQAEAAATLPIQSATGFAVLDNDGHWVELEPTGDGLPVIGVQISNSPLTPEERAAMKAERKAARDALKEAAQDKKLNDKAKVALLMRAVFGVEE